MSQKQAGFVVAPNMSSMGWLGGVALSEDEVAEALIASASHLQLGELVGCAVGGQAGFDVAFRTSDQRLHAFEIKGSHPGWDDCQRQFDSGFGQLPLIACGLKSLRTLDNVLENGVRPDFVSLALPDHEDFRRRSDALISAFEVLGYGLYFVRLDSVECALEPNQILLG